MWCCRGRGIRWAGWLSVMMAVAGCGGSARPRSQFAPSEIYGPDGTAVPFQDEDRGSPIIPVRINNTYDAAMMLDTGASYSMVSESAARKSGLDVHKVELDSSDGSGTVGHLHGWVGIDEMEIGNLRFVRTPATMGDVGVLQHKHAETAVDGILGLPTFQDTLLTVDYPNRRIVIMRGALPEPNGRDILPMELKDGGCFVTLTVNGRPLKVLLDTGCSEGLLLPTEQSALVSGANRAIAGQDAQMWYSTMHTLLYRSEDSVWIGDREIERPIVCVAEDAKIPTLGMGYLKHFAVTIDQQNGRIRFEYSSVGAINVPPIMVAGFWADRSTGEVLGVMAGSEAERCGLAVGDHIKLDNVFHLGVPGFHSAALAERDVLSLRVDHAGSERRVRVPMTLLLP